MRSDISYHYRILFCEDINTEAIINMFQMMDVDSDGVISFDDFMTCCMDDYVILQSMKELEDIQIMV